MLTDDAEVTWGGRLFQTRGPATENALLRSWSWGYISPVLRHQSDAVTFDVEDGGRRVSPITTYNSVLTGLPAYFLKRLQSVLNTSARLIYGLRRYDHVSEALMSLQWLHIPEHIQFKFAVLVHRVLHGNAPDYLWPFTRLSNVTSWSSLQSSSSHHLLILKFVAWLLVFLGQLFGTVYRLTLRLSTVCQFFVIVSKIICSCTRIQAPFNNRISFSIVAVKLFILHLVTLILEKLMN